LCYILCHNNLHLNRVKSVELIVSAPRRRRTFPMHTGN